MHMRGLTTRLRTPGLAFATAAMSMLAVGCAISDYQGWLGHQTESEAKLWGSQVAILTQPDPTGDSGTYEYTVKYDWRSVTTDPNMTGNQFPVVTIFSYRNPVFAAFSRDGCVDRDGDELQQRPGAVNRGNGCNLAVPEGKFRPKWEFEDRAPGCQFFANFKKEYDSPPKNPPAAALCLTAPSEEIDKDLDLQGSAASNVKESFASIDALLGAIWSGAVGRTFTLNITSVKVNGTEMPLAAPAALSVQRNDVRPLNVAVDLNSPGAQSLIRALLTGTTNGAPATLEFTFDGGMHVAQPRILTVAFSHDELTSMLQ
jgi:hypothetical protein